jgi:hypothetical protein
VVCGGRKADDFSVYLPKKLPVLDVPGLEKKTQAQALELHVHITMLWRLQSPLVAIGPFVGHGRVGECQENIIPPSKIVNKEGRDDSKVLARQMSPWWRSFHITCFG